MANNYQMLNTMVPYVGFTAYTPTVPKLYWDVYSSEQRIKALCCEYEKLKCYSQAMANLLNNAIYVVNQMEEELPDLVLDSLLNNEELKNDIKTILEQWLADTLRGMTYEELTNNGFLYHE